MNVAEFAKIQPTVDCGTPIMHCPTCERDFDPKESPALPFCSERCRLVDLGRWLDEAHGLPSVPDPEDFVDEGQSPKKD